LNDSAFPTLNGNSVLTRHVYTADSAPGIFLNIGKLRWGDEVIIRVGNQSYVYEVRQVIDLVDPSDVETLMEHMGNPWLSLVTCEGYDEETNTYQWRYFVRAVLTKSE
jgi:LPXTG-site transpeptidase (sortase) family protein